MLSSCLFNLHADYIMPNARLDEAQAGIKIAGRNINNLRHRRQHPYGRKWRGTEEPLDENEKGDWKIWLKLNIQKIKITAFGPITSWQIDSEAMENDWRQEEKGMTEVGWHHWLDGHEFEQAPGIGGGQGSLASAVHRSLRIQHDCVTDLNWTECKES